ncbi:MAG: group 1 truncated hemoglobin [Cyanobacteria bacterium CRU_2_1]|nr:group 1 truncated hemoglobin [Cyanobacteria bacterium CRU_2_1]
MKALFEKLGGSDSVELVVDKFYDRVLHDERIKHFFDGVDMNRQRAHQRAFLTYAFGGASHYNGRHLRAAHQELVTEKGLSSEHFDAVAEDLVETLKEMGVSQELIDEVAAVVADPQNKQDVLNQ